MQEELNDFELLYLCQSKNEVATDLLYQKYNPLVHLIVYRLKKYACNSGLEEEDLLQEGLLGFSRAIQMFDPDKENSFYTFAKKCIESAVISYIIKNKRQKHKVLNESMSIEVMDEEGYRNLFGIILEDESATPEELLIGKENAEEILCALKQELSTTESQVLELKLSDFNYKEIADILEVDPKSIDNALQRMKQKLKEILRKREME